MSLQILYSSGRLDAAYFTCHQVLIDLDETIPDSIDSQELTLMVKETGKLLENISGHVIGEMKAMNSVPSLTQKFLSLLVRSYISCLVSCDNICTPHIISFCCSVAEYCIF